MKKYPKIQFPVLQCGRFAHNPSWGVWRAITFCLMHLVMHPYATHLGGKECKLLELSSPPRPMHCAGEREWGLYYAIDANVGDPDVPSISSVVGMLAGGTIDSNASRQHHKNGESHTSEVVAAGTGLAFLTTTRGITHEAHVAQVVPTPAYFDSSTTIFVANDDAAPKRALWLRRRVAVLREGVEHGEFSPVKVDEADNIADVHTKYLAYPQWVRHIRWISNLT